MVPLATLRELSANTTTGSGRVVLLNEDGGYTRSDCSQKEKKTNGKDEFSISLKVAKSDMVGLVEFNRDGTHLHELANVLVTQLVKVPEA